MEYLFAGLFILAIVFLACLYNAGVAPDEDNRPHRISRWLIP